VVAGHEPEVIRLFLDALAVWQDAESWAYLRDLTGQYSLEVSLPGSDRRQAPTIIEETWLPDDAAIVRLSDASRESLGFGGSADIIVSRVRGRTPCHWLIATREDRNGRREAQIAVYVHVVGQALREVAAIESSRLTWAMMQRLLVPASSPELAAHDALSELSAISDAPASLAVCRNDGLRILVVGVPTRALSLPVPSVEADVLVLPVEVAPPYTAVISISRPPGRRLTPRDEQLVRTAASTFGPWLNAALQRLDDGRERRTAARPFDQIIEQYADRAIAQRGEVSVVVLRVREAAARPDLVHMWIAHIRRQLRVADLAGRLISGDVGILLPDTPIDGAQVVADRVRLLMGSDVDRGERLNVGIGFARCGEGSASPQSLLRNARAFADADRVGGANNTHGA
jgi:hypothetical protein